MLPHADLTCCLRLQVLHFAGFGIRPLILQSCLLICWGCKMRGLHPVRWQHLGHISRLGQLPLGCVLCRADTAASADYVEEQWCFYGFCDTFEQAHYIAVQGLSAGLGEPFHSCQLPTVLRCAAPHHPCIPCFHAFASTESAPATHC